MWFSNENLFFLHREIKVGFFLTWFINRFSSSEHCCLINTSFLISNTKRSSAFLLYSSRLESFLIWKLYRQFLKQDFTSPYQLTYSIHLGWSFTNAPQARHFYHMSIKLLISSTLFFLLPLLPKHFPFPTNAVSYLFVKILFLYKHFIFSNKVKSSNKCVILRKRLHRNPSNFKNWTYHKIL